MIEMSENERVVLVLKVMIFRRMQKRGKFANVLRANEMYWIALNFLETKLNG